MSDFRLASALTSVGVDEVADVVEDAIFLDERVEDDRERLGSLNMI